MESPPLDALPWKSSGSDGAGSPGGQHMSRNRFVSTATIAAALIAVFASSAIAARAQEEPRDLDRYAREFPAETRAEPRDLSPAQLAEVAKHPLGSRQNPVRCYTPANEAAYLTRLRCANGKAPKFERLGFDGIGPYGTSLDSFELTCRSWTGKKKFHVYLDMSHEGVVETQPIPGFQIEEPTEFELTTATAPGDA